MKHHTKPSLRRSLRATTLLACLLVSLLLPAAAFAQVDPGVHDLYQDELLVGVVFVPPRTAGACSYFEYWFLFDEYRYPGPNQRVATTLRTVETIDPEALQRLSDGKGHWVTVKATEDRPECRG